MIQNPQTRLHLYVVKTGTSWRHELQCPWTRPLFLYTRKETEIKDNGRSKLNNYGQYTPWNTGWLKRNTLHILPTHPHTHTHTHSDTPCLHINSKDLCLHSKAPGKMVKRMRVKDGECMHIKQFTHQNNGGCVVLKVTIPCHGNQNLLICTVTLVTLVVVFLCVYKQILPYTNDSLWTSTILTNQSSPLQSLMTTTSFKKKKHFRGKDNKNPFNAQIKLVTRMCKPTLNK